MYPPQKRVYEVDQNRTKLPLPGGMPGGGMVTSQIESCIVLFLIPLDSNFFNCTAVPV